MGGLSSERKISMDSGTAVAEALRTRGWNVIEIDVDHQLPEKMKVERIDVAWNALHGIYGEDGCVQGLLEMMNIPYTGSSVQSCAISMDKRATKLMLNDTVVNLIPDRMVRHGEEVEDKWFPCVLKDPVGGSSIGVWICHTPKDLKTAYTQSDTEMFLLERYIQGEEITVAVFIDQAYPVVSIRPKEGFFDLEAKYTKGKTEYLVPSPLSQEICINAQEQAVEAYHKLNMSGIARADFIVTTQGEIFFLEINASPGMTATSLSPMAAQAVGISFPELVEQILHTAKCSRTQHKK
jgi:D-alanine-D-alanine ligase